MTILLMALFFITGFLFVYPYVVYPPLVGYLAQRWPMGSAAPAVPAGGLPSISLVISAYNEEAVIGRKLDNALGLDYPPEHLAIYVVSDASDDGTDDMVRAYAARDGRVHLVRQEERLGKTAGLNLAMERVDSDLVVFSDANAMYAPNALRELAAPFADPGVGYVVGAALYNEDAANAATHSEGMYWNMELTLKARESAFDSVVGGDGAIYAIRRELFWPLQQDDINDFVNPLQIINAGYRGVFNPRAVCHEDAAEAFDKEFRRKRRIVNRTWRAVKRYGGGLNLNDHGRYIFMLVSHKILRWFAVPMLGVFFLSALLLASAGWLFELVAVAVAVFLTLAAAGRQFDMAGRPIPRLFYIPYYFLLVHVAAMLGIIDETRGVRHAVWSHVRKG